MSYFVDSAFLAAQAEITPKFTEAELRERQNPILRTGLANQDFVMANIAEIKKSTKSGVRGVKGYQFKRKAAGSTTQIPDTFDSSIGDTMEVELSWNAYSEPIGLLLNSGSDNVMSNAKMLADGFRQAQRNIRERIGKALVTALHEARTTTSNATIRNATFNAANDAFEIENSEMFFAFMKSIMTQHKYYGELDIITDSVLDPMARKIAAQGQFAGTNLSYQLQGMNIMPHDILGTEVAVSAYPNGGVALALPQNSFAFIPFVDEAYRNGWGSFENFNGGYATIPDDTGLPLTYMVRGFSEKKDGRNLGGTYDDIKYNFMVSCKVATQVAQISESGEKPVYEFALV